MTVATELGRATRSIPYGLRGARGGGSRCTVQSLLAIRQHRYSSSAPASDITADIGGAANVEHLARIARDFRTDTITMPTDAQIMYAVQATRGDDVEQEDATTAALEERIARLAGKEAALLCVSSTMTNVLATRSHLAQPPHSIVVDARSHTHLNEAGGAAMFSQAQTHSLTPENGLYLTLEDIEPALQLGNDIHIAPTRLICLENTINGVIVPLTEMNRISWLAKEHDIALHLDGARAWNVAATEIERRGLDATKEDDFQTVLSDILAPFDSVSLCLSKGLGAPIGSALVGSTDLINRARWFRKAFGGGWRQSGFLAAAADWAITHHFPRLAGTHSLARQLALGLADAGCDILAPVDTNMVFFDGERLGLQFKQIKEALAVLPDPIRLGSNRLVVHHQTSPKAVDDMIAEVSRLAALVPQSQKHRRYEKATLGYRD